MTKSCTSVIIICYIKRKAAIYILPIILAIENEVDRTFVASIYTQYEKKMYATAYEILQNHYDAEDTVHDVIVKIIDKHTNDKDQLDNDITCILEEVPTVYDLEKVERKIKDYFKGQIDKVSGEEAWKICEYNKAVCEIIRKGGVV